MIIHRMVHSTYLGGGGGVHASQVFQHVAACCAQVKNHSSELALEVVEVREEGEEGMGACSSNTELEMASHPVSWCCIGLMMYCSRHRAADCVFLDLSECCSPDVGLTVAKHMCKTSEAHGGEGGGGGGGLSPKIVPTTCGRPNGAAVVVCCS